MRIVRASSEAEAAETFVRAELQSPRFRDDVLAGTRGWRVGGLFEGLPTDLDWERVALTPDEVLSIRYVHWHWWLKISGATRSPREAARRIHAGLVPGADTEADRLIATRLRSDDPPPELIAVARPGDRMVLLEGHVRLTAYALWPEYPRASWRSCSAFRRTVPPGAVTEPGALPCGRPSRRARPGGDPLSAASGRRRCASRT